MIQIKQLSYRYEKKSPKVIDDFSLCIESNKVMGLIGANGVGKTTLLKLLASWLLPSQGDIEYSIDNKSFNSKKRDTEYLTDVYLLPEQQELMFCTVATYVKIMSKFYPNFDMAIWDKAVQTFNIDIQVHLTKLSTGWLKKVYLAFALSTKCKVLLMDEPTNPLDITSKEQFRSLLPFCLDDSQTLIISTHQVRDLEQVFDTVMFMDESRTELVELMDMNQNIETLYKSFLTSSVKVGV